MVVTQEVDDIISSPVVKESIINNSDCKILLDQRKYMNKFDQIRGVARTDGKEGADTLHQHGEQPFTALQGGVDRLGRPAVSGICHGGQSLKEYLVAPVKGFDECRFGKRLGKCLNAH